MSSTSTVTRWLINGTLIAGAFDITYATAWSYFRSGIAPTFILKYVASGLLGPSALQGGAGTAAVGLGLHFFNAFLFTAFFFLVASRMPALVRKPVLVGAFYGIGVYGVMNYIVVPLSRIGPRPTPATPTWVSGLLVHMFLIGVPIALAARRAFSDR